MRLLLASLLLIPAWLGAQSGLSALRLSAGARPAALADIGAVLTGPETANPAALSAGAPCGRALALSHNAWIAGIDQEYIHLLSECGRSTWGLRAQLWQAEGLERRAGPSQEALGRFGVYESSVGLAHARRLGSGLRLGARLKLVRQSIWRRAASGWAADLGAWYPLAADLRLGAALLNAGRMGALDREATPLPAEGRAGLSWSGRQRLLLAAEVQKARGVAPSLHLAAQYQTGARLALRVGYQTAASRGFSGGFGLRAGAWTFDYAYLPFGSGLGEAHYLSLQRSSR